MKFPDVNLTIAEGEEFLQKFGLAHD